MLVYNNRKNVAHNIWDPKNTEKSSIAKLKTLISIWWSLQSNVILFNENFGAGI